MTDLVPTKDIERIVGTTRHPHLHYGCAVSAEQTVYILHSQECLDSGIDLRDCLFSVALDQGIDLDVWDGFEDVPVELMILGDFGWWQDGGRGTLAPFKRVAAGTDRSGT